MDSRQLVVITVFSAPIPLSKTSAISQRNQHIWNRILSISDISPVPKKKYLTEKKHEAKFSEKRIGY